MVEKDSHVPMLLRICALLSRHPGERYSVEQIASMVGSYYQAVREPLWRGQNSGKISMGKPQPKSVVYYATPQQAAAIQAELKEIAGSYLRWVDTPNPVAERPAPAVMVKRAARPGQPSPPPVLVLLDPAVVSSRLTYLRRLRDNSIFGEDRALKDIIADYEATLARTSAAA